MSHNDNEFGRRVASLRKEKGYTQEKISAMLNVTPQAISKWEQGNAWPDTLLLPLLAKLLNVSIDYLLTGTSLVGQAGPYDAEYQKEPYYWGMKPSELAEQIAELAGNDTVNKRVLDIGSGEGRDAVYFAKCGFQVDALEVSIPGAEKIRQYSQLSGYAVNILLADMIGYELAGVYDVIYSHGSLQFYRRSNGKGTLTNTNNRRNREG